jgi:hypothetical protein
VTLGITSAATIFLCIGFTIAVFLSAETFGFGPGLGGRAVIEAVIAHLFIIFKLDRNSSVVDTGCELIGIIGMRRFFFLHLGY